MQRVGNVVMKNDGSLVENRLIKQVLLALSIRTNSNGALQFMRGFGDTIFKPL